MAKDHGGAEFGVAFVFAAVGGLFFGVWQHNIAAGGWMIILLFVLIMIGTDMATRR